MAGDQHRHSAEGAFENESTHADADWPVAPQYDVVPGPDLEHGLDEETGAVTIAPAPRRSGIPAAVALSAVAALLVLAGAAAAWLATRPDRSSAGAPPAQPRAGHGSTTPHKGSGGPSAVTSTARNTTEASTSTDATSTTTTDAVRTAAVPSVIGLKASDAARRLRHAQLVPAIRLVASSHGEGTVLAQKPEAETRLDIGSRVELRVAREAKPTRVTMPSLVGWTAANAKERLRSLALHWSVTTRDSSRPRGVVLAQSPSPRSEIAKGTTVRLTVSSGPAQVPVPDVTGLDESSAEAQLRDAGFDVAVVDQPTSDPEQDGMVVDQTPAGGSNAAKSSTVTITVARSN